MSYEVTKNAPKVWGYFSWTRTYSERGGSWDHKRFCSSQHLIQKNCPGTVRRKDNFVYKWTDFVKLFAKTERHPKFLRIGATLNLEDSNFFSCGLFNAIFCVNDFTLRPQKRDRGNATRALSSLRDLALPVYKNVSHQNCFGERVLWFEGR